MDWKTRDKGLTTQEAKAQLLAISQESGPIPLISGNPLRAVLIALAAGFVVSRFAPTFRWAGQAGWSLASQFLIPQGSPSPSALERLRLRAYRRSTR